MTVNELKTWYAYAELEPWGEVRQDARIAILGSAVCGSMGAKVEPRDLIPNFNPTRNHMSLAEFKAYVSAHNERIKN
jgi:hypothetical protein